MNHSLFAGSFCTLAILFLALEVAIYKPKVLPKKFFLFYGLSCVFWVALAIDTNQEALFGIGVIQLIGTIIAYYINKEIHGAK